MALSYTVQASTLGRLCRHTWDTPLSEINEDYLKKLFATSIVYGPMFFFAKAAILILYYRAFGTKTWMRWTCWTMGVILFGAYWQTGEFLFLILLLNAWVRVTVGLTKAQFPRRSSTACPTMEGLGMLPFWWAAIV